MALWIAEQGEGGAASFWLKNPRFHESGLRGQECYRFRVARWSRRRNYRSVFLSRAPRVLRMFSRHFTMPMAELVATVSMVETHLKAPTMDEDEA